MTREGKVEAHRPGEVTLVVLVPTNPDDTSRRPDARVRTEVTVTVPQLPVERVAFARAPVEVLRPVPRPRLDVEGDRHGWIHAS